MFKYQDSQHTAHLQANGLFLGSKFEGILEGRRHYFKSNDYCVLEVIGITFFPSKACTCKSPENPGSEVIR